MNTLHMTLIGIGGGLMIGGLIGGAALPTMAENSAALKTASQDQDKPNPYAKADESWISLSGQAVNTRVGKFTLDYGEGTVLVEVDDWDWYDANTDMLEGDKVTVYGRVDDDMFELTKIEASSIYVENLGTYFYGDASAADEESDAYWIDPDYDPIVVGQTTVRGTVSSVSGREFTVNTGLQAITVDTIGMGYNPLDDQGYQQIEKGDYVSVSGDMEYGFWEGRELSADSVVTLFNDMN